MCFTQETTDLNSPRLACRVEWSFKPTQVTFLIFVLEINHDGLFRPSSSVNVDSSMTANVSSGDSDALRLEMRKSLYISQVSKCSIHHRLGIH